ncbi:homoserine dehydrogenase [Pseudoflavonifractor sp. 60]|uniref:homoserine dehydrogenase n=1 Tax=Pseudoflavonifractor sp. 60 TaxID=2304576 RepID=UPI00136D8AED|nr:homoserine dehydrogenase [Pseudoflavonifractor sp. 60]NBI66063.1 homoserine dehydrogenase [Pseudoflavonifractor sp. 60]
MVNVAILGFGTVGSGVAEVLTTNGGLIDNRVRDLVRLKYILDVRDFPDSPYKDCFVKDFAVIESDPEVDIVVETIGGAKIALEFTARALKAGKSVVTSNKELVATHGCELLQLAREHGCSYLFEASVGGGIPILRPLTSCLAANELEQITGILNGTTNYILTRMIRAGLTFEQALKEAQTNGYAEKDPTADVDGHDACRKICILADLAFGRQVDPALVPTEGIRNVTLEDVAYADSVGYQIKLLGRCLRQEEGRVCAFVAPHLVPAGNPLSGVEDVFNAIAVTGNAIGDVMFYGRGAGKLPTASAVVADVIDIAKDLKKDRHNGWEAGSPDLVVSADYLMSPWYVRGQMSADQARKSCGEVQLLARSGAPAGECAFLTAPMTEPEVKEKLAGLEVGSRIRVLS